MRFNQNYIKQFTLQADQIKSKYSNTLPNPIRLGQLVYCNIPEKAIIEIVELWVNRIDKLLELTNQAYKENAEAIYNKIYKHRCITFNEFYYLFSKHINEEEYLSTPAFLFTQTFSKDLRDRKFYNTEYSESSYTDFILGLDTIPSKYLKSFDEAQISLNEMYAHTYCVAKTRSGKTELLKLIIHNLIKHKDENTSLLILDPHGEFASEIKRFSILQDRIEDFIYLDPAINEEYTPVFNPFEIEDKSSMALAYATDNILEAFEQLLIDQNITGNMRRLLRHCIYALLFLDDTTLMDLHIILSALSRNKNKKESNFYEHEQLLLEKCKTVEDPLTRQFFEYGWHQVDARTLSAVMERVDGILAHPLVRNFVVGNSSFDLNKMLNTGKIIVVNLDFTKLGNIGSEAIGRLIISQTQNISAGRNRLPRHQRPRTLIFMDECQRFVSSAIERALSEFGKFNTYLYLSHQYIDQIDDGMIKAMLSNTENKIIGRNSATSLASISSDIAVPIEELSNIKKYHFYLKAGDQDPILFKSDDILIDHVDNRHYINQENVESLVDDYMISKYYNPVNNINSLHNKDLEQVDQLLKTISVTIDESEF